MRDAVLALSQRHAFARRLVNSGRLSTPTAHRGNALSTADRDSFACALAPALPQRMPRCRLLVALSLLDQLGGRFDLLIFDAKTVGRLRCNPNSEAIFVCPHCTGGKTGHTCSKTSKD